MKNLGIKIYYFFTEKPFQAIKKKIISGREIYNSTEGYELSVFTWLYIDNIIENYGTKKYTNKR